MQLNEILEENSTKAISKKTMISEENIELLVAGDFSSLAKAKALGFISIIERDFKADLSSLKKSALAYYNENTDKEDAVNIALPRVEEKQGRSKWFPVLMLGLLAYASWYFFTQFDKKTLSTILPFSDEKTEMISTAQMELEEDKGLSIANALTAEKEVDTAGVEANIVVASIEPENVVVVAPSPKVTTIVSERPIKREVHALVRNKNIILLPAKKLWFGIVDMATGKRDHHTVRKQYKIDVTKKSWLIATSKAEFAFINGSRTQEFDDAQSHYFKVSRQGIEELSKKEYISQGGYKKW